MSSISGSGKAEFKITKPEITYEKTGEIRITNPNMYNVLMTGLNKQREAGVRCDFIIEAGDGGSFPIHKSVMSAASPYFERYFRSEEFLNSKPESLEIDEIRSSDILLSVIKYIYLGKIEIKSENVEEILKAATLFELTQLIHKCNEFIKSNNM